MSLESELKVCKRMHGKVLPKFCGTHPQCAGCPEVPKGVSPYKEKWVNTWGGLSGATVKNNLMKADEYVPSTDTV